MYYRLLFITLAALVCAPAWAQTDTTSRRSTHFVGVQANQLLRQILNFGNSSPAVNNPYLLTYSMNSRKSGHGFSIGVGYFFNELVDGDLGNNRETTIDDLNLRIGWERKTYLGRSRKWICSYGFDVLRESVKNETKVTTDNEFSKASITTTSKSSGTGFGPRLTLNYIFTDRLMIGTEVNYYFMRAKTELEVNSEISTQQWDPNTGNTTWVTVKDNEEHVDKTKHFEMTPPVAIFLVLMF